MESGESLITLHDLAKYLQVHPTTIYRLIRTNRIPALRFGGNWRFHRGAIDKWVEQMAASKIDPPKRGRQKPKAR